VVKPDDIRIRNKMIVVTAISIALATLAMLFQPSRFEHVMNYVGVFLMAWFFCFVLAGSAFFTPQGTE